MKSLLGLVLFAGVLTSLDGVDGMIPEAKNAQPTQTTNVSDGWTQEEKDWGVDKVFKYFEFYASAEKDLYRSPEGDQEFFIQANSETINELEHYLKNDLNPEEIEKGHLSKFAVFLIAKGWLKYFYILSEECYLVPGKNSKIDKECFRNLFTTFINLKNDYDLVIQNSDLTKSESPFIQWLLQDSQAIKWIRDRSTNSQLPWNVSSWADCCGMQSQYSLGWPAPGKKPSK